MKDDGGPAFPVPFMYQPDQGPNGMYVDGADAGAATGLTLRDYFAAKVMQADLTSDPMGRIWTNDGMSVRAGIYYEMADAMLAARAKP